MAKRKLSIVNLELGMNPDKEVNISPKTEKRIQKVVQDTVKEKDLLEKVRVKRQTKAIEKCLRVLVKATEKNETVPAQKLLEIAESESLPGTILKINNLIKKRDGVWILKKKKVAGKTHYSLVPS